MIDLNKLDRVEEKPKLSKGQVEIIVPPQTVPWVEVKLTDDVMKHLWDVTKDGEKESKCMKSTLIGNISKSFSITDKNNYFFNEVLNPVIRQYDNKVPDTAKHIFNNIPPAVDEKGHLMIPCANTLFLETFWANYQYKHEFNPIHDHTGAFSFVIWMKIPYDYKEQRKEKFLDGINESYKQGGNFYFEYINMFGEVTTTTYEMSPDMEGTMLLFPSRLRHGVNPFYSCDEKRVSISGNVKYVIKYRKA